MALLVGVRILFFHQALWLRLCPSWPFVVGTGEGTAGKIGGSDEHLVTPYLVPGLCELVLQLGEAEAGDSDEVTHHRDKPVIWLLKLAFLILQFLRRESEGLVRPQPGCPGILTAFIFLADHRVGNLFPFGVQGRCWN